MAMGVWYATREQVKNALDMKGTSVNDEQVDRALEDQSRAVEGYLSRPRFYPLIATKKYDYPNWQYARPWKLYLGQDELLSVTTLVSGGITIAPSSYFLEPVNEGPPYTEIALNISTTAGFTANAGTWQQSIILTGVFGYDDNRETDSATIVSGINASVTSLDVTNSANIGVGSLLIIDSERMIVTDRAQLSTAQTLQTPLTASMANTTVAVTSGSAYARREVITLDAERMKIDDIVGNSLIVRRAWDGTPLAAHAGSTIYAPRTLTVTRGALGTTAATHSGGAVAYRQRMAPQSLVLAEAINQVEQEQSAYARTIGSGDNVRNAGGAGLADLRARSLRALGRQGRMYAV